MLKFMLIASVAACAITAPAQAQRGERRAQAEERAQKSERAEKRAKRAEARQRAPERRAQRVRADRPKARERASENRPRMQARERARVERRSAQAQNRARSQERVERRTRAAERAAPQRVERQRVQRQRVEQRRADRQRLERRTRNERLAVGQNRAVERRSVERRQAARRDRIDRRSDNRFAAQQLRQQKRQERLARAERRIERRGDRLEARTRQQLRFADSSRRERLFQRPSRSVGDRLELRQRRAERDRRDAFLTQRFRTYAASPGHYFYRDYDDGYLYQVRRDSNVVTAALPFLGGAFSVGQPLPVGYSSYNVPYAYRGLYYDTPDYRYRYGDGAVYLVDRETQLIQAVVALLTGRSLGVGQMLPAGYDVYNVPYAYRDRYRDTDDMWYRYSDGYIYGVNPYNRRIQTMIPLSYGGYAVGYPAPSYASYGGYTGYGAYPGNYAPYAYNPLYYSQPGYNYHYANGGIYQVDPATQLVSALVALVTGVNLGVGQTLPMGYDVYNVPYAYRANYFDTADAWYRYDDGYIYQVDPRSRLIQAAIPVSYDGFVVGQPVPAAYPGYAVPARYDNLYYAAPGHDYRYFDRGIYQIDPQTRIVQSQVALLTGQTLGVGQMLPIGYDVYNVPYAYRDRYYDSDRYLYRYADGYIYQVDPRTRLIQAVIDAIA